MDGSVQIEAMANGRLDGCRRVDANIDRNHTLV
jgi:hypothetical protein